MNNLNINYTYNFIIHITISILFVINILFNFSRSLIFFICFTDDHNRWWWWQTEEEPIQCQWCRPRHAQIFPYASCHRWWLFIYAALWYRCLFLYYINSLVEPPMSVSFVLLVHGIVDSCCCSWNGHLLLN